MHTAARNEPHRVGDLLTAETASGHFGHFHVAAGDGLHHLARVLELLHQAVYVGHRRAAALGQPLAPPGVDNLGLLSFGGGHLVDDRLGLLEHVVRNLHPLEHLAQPW